MGVAGGRDRRGDTAPLEDVKFQYGAMQITTLNPVTAAVQSQASFSFVTNQPNFDVPGVTALSLPKGLDVSAKAIATRP